MTQASVTGALGLYVPSILPHMGALPALADTGLLDATGETVHLIGRVYFNGRPASSKAFSTTTAAIRWLPGASITFAAGDTLNVGIQSASTTAGPPARASSSTPAIYKALVGGVDTITSTTWRTDTFDTGSISNITHGDLIALVFNMSLRSTGSVKVRLSTTGANAVGGMPSAALEAPAATYTGIVPTPNAIIVADDGTLGWLDGSYIYSSFGTNAINSGSGTKEYANVFQVPWDCKADGIWFIVSPAGSTSDFAADLYSDPLAAGAGPTSMASVATDGNTIGSASRFHFQPFTAEQSLTRNTDYAVALRPTTANNVTIPFSAVNVVAEWAAHGLGSLCYAASRGTVGAGTAFASISSGVQRIYAGVRISSFDDGTGTGSGTTIAGTPMRRGMV